MLAERGERVAVEPAPPWQGTAPTKVVGVPLEMVNGERGHAFLEDDDVLRNAKPLAGIPGGAVHGRFDIGRPPDFVGQLAPAWPW